MIENPFLWHPHIILIRANGFIVLVLIIFYTGYYLHNFGNHRSTIINFALYNFY